MTVKQMAMATRGASAPSATTSSGRVPRAALSASSPRITRRSRPRAKSVSNILNHPEQAVEFNDDTLLDQDEREGDDLAALIDFLRNHAPPSDNFMSIPENDGRGPWSVLKKLGKRSQSLPKPPPIRLPDSAVSGTTIGGHRHIAISIPTEASPFGQTPRSQYPIIENGGTKPITSSFAPTRTFLNEKGVVTVLKTVTEDRETPSPPSPSSSLLRPSPGSRQPSLTPGGTASSPESRIRRNNKEHGDYFSSVLPAITYSNVLQEGQTGYETRGKSNTEDRTQSLNTRSNYPVRSSSWTASRAALPATSIDSMMSQEIDMECLPSSRGTSRSLSSSHQNLQSISGSVSTTYNDPVVSDARQIGTARSTPIFVDKSEWQTPPLRRNRSDAAKVTVITENPFGESETNDSSSRSIRSVQSRKEKVRDRKRRDMEALRSTSRGRQAHGNGQEQNQPPMPNEARTIDRDEVSSIQKESGQQLTISPMMVVSDVMPSPPLVGKKTRRRSRPSPIITKPLTSNSAIMAAVACSRGSSNPTPPHSAQGSPASQHTFDRTSLSRRREWNAIREKEQKNRETKAALRAKTRQISLAKEKSDKARDRARDKGPMVEEEVLVRYEAYRDYRIREMERRVRRLERNGDVWLRALVPVLDNLNKSLANIHDDHPGCSRGWISDDDCPELLLAKEEEEERRGRSVIHRGYLGRGRSFRYSRASERQLLDELTRRRDVDDLESSDNSLSDEMSGLDTIEPLMRELAGRSRLSFEATRRTLSDEERR